MPLLHPKIPQGTKSEVIQLNWKDGLKWVFFLFCTIFTFQILFAIVIVDGVFNAHLAPSIFSYKHLMETMLIALISALPALIFVQSKVFLWMPMWVRRAVHFLLTFGAVFGVLLYSDAYDMSGWFLLPFLFFLIIYVFAILFYEKYVLAKKKAQQHAEEEKRLRYYMDEVERQYISTQKFKHDYRNILFSLECFICEDDWDGFKQYYMDKIKKASEIVTNEIFSLEGLSKIKVREIKSILAGKLMMAQNMGIDSVFQADDEITCFHVDSVDLVRILGILLDNAIEELAESSHGTLSIGCFNEETGIAIVVQNTCRPDDMPKLHQMWQQGFSTKGSGRGLGLSTLSELVDKHSNLMLETTIVDGSFVQKLKIGKM